MKPKLWILPTPPTNNDAVTSSTAASNFTSEIQPDPVQPGKIRLYSWMLYPPQAPVLDLRNQNVTLSTLHLRDTIHQLRLCPTEDETQGEWSTNGRKKSPKINPVFKTSEEERHYGTIPSSALATQIVLSHSRAKANPTVERGPNRKVRVKKLPKEKAKDKSTQTKKQKKQTK